MEVKKGAGILLAPKILCEKVLTNASGCDIIKAQKTKGAKENERTSELATSVFRV